MQCAENTLNYNGKWYCSFSCVIIATKGVVNRRGRGKTEGKVEEEERGENSRHVGRSDL